MNNDLMRCVVFKHPIAKMSKEEQKKYVETRFKQYVYAFILSKYFRVKCSKISEAKPLFYLLPYIYELETPFNG